MFEVGRHLSQELGMDPVMIFPAYDAETRV